jgi:hypothetical protein
VDSGTRDATAPGRSGSPGAPHAGGRWRRLARTLTQRPWVEHALRAGLVARAVVYLLLAYLVARIAFGILGGPGTSAAASGPGVAQAIARKPGGHVALFVLAVGLVLYAAFSAVDALTHHDRESPAAKRWGDRALSAWGVLVYGVFSVYCFVTVGSAHPSGHGSAQSQQQDEQWSARVLRWPAGQVWLALLGAVLLAIAAFLLARAIRRSFRSRLERTRMNTHVWRLAVALGAAGYGGRALLFGIVGWFVMNAAVEDDPQHGQGVDGSIRLLAADPAGPPVLCILAAGLALYGAYLLLEAHYRRV